MILAQPGDPLSDIEEQLLPFLAEGLTTSEIAVYVERSPHTVHSRLSRMFIKTDTSTKASLVAWAFRNGMLK